MGPGDEDLPLQLVQLRRNCLRRRRIWRVNVTDNWNKTPVSKDALTDVSLKLRHLHIGISNAAGLGAIATRQDRW